MQDNQDLIRCEDEPIRIPSLTQSFGGFIILDNKNLNIVQVSSNIKAFTGYEVHFLLNKKVSFLFESTTLQNKLYSLNKEGQTYLEKSTIFGKVSTNFFLRYYRIGSFIYLEVEKDVTASSEAQSAKFGLFLGNYMQGLENYPALLDVLQYTTEQVKSHLGFDRVMIYQFDQDWNGSVVAESCEAHMEPFLGLHFPASDIPAQARELYRENRIRMIPDVSSSPVELIPTLNPLTQAKPDLSMVSLRSVSPIHLEYLQNMGVGASFSLSILYQGQLWGLIACHHHACFYLDPETRRSTELFSKIFSNYLEVRIQKDEIEQSKSYIQQEVSLVQELSQSRNLGSTYSKFHEQLIEVNSAQGGAYTFNTSSIQAFGSAPPREDIENVIRWISSQPHTPIFYTHNMGSFLKLSEEGIQKMSGVLAIRFSSQSSEMILWFKPEEIETVYWAGDKNKAMILDEKEGKYRLSPRKSFDKWQEIRQGFAKPWSSSEIEIALRLRSHIFEVIQSIRTEEINRKLQDINDELNAFNYTVSHDLKQPIRNIENYSAILLEEFKDTIEEAGIFMLQTINDSTQVLTQIIEDLLEYSRVSRSNNEYVHLNMDKLIKEAFKATAHPLDKTIDLQVQEALPNLRGDTILIRHLLLNVLDNAVKYSQHQKVSKILVRGQDDSNYTYYTFSDNGIGIPVEQRKKVFQIFFRLHNEGKYEGNGLGLAIVQRITLRHGGRVWIESNAWGGTDVCFSFPKSSDYLEITSEM